MYDIGTMLTQQIMNSKKWLKISWCNLVNNYQTLPTFIREFFTRTYTKNTDL